MTDRSIIYVKSELPKKEEHMENGIRKQQVANMVEKLYKTEKYSSSKRGEIINLTTKIENTLTDIFACIFYPGKYTQDIEATKLLVKERIEFKSLILWKINFRDKIEDLYNTILVKKPEIIETNKAFVKTLVKELNKVREFRNIIAHSELDLFSAEFIRELAHDVSENIEKFPLIEYKKGKAIPHMISDKRIKNEIKKMEDIWERLGKLLALVKGNIKSIND